MKPKQKLFIIIVTAVVVSVCVWYIRINDVYS